MNKNKFLNIDGAVLSKSQLETHLEKISASHTLCEKSEKETYPVSRMLENFQAIKEVYNLLNIHLKKDIIIHPAGEWLLDNFYIIEESVKAIEKELTLKKYTNFIGIQNGKYQGFARIYVLAVEIISYTDGKCDQKSLESYLQAYQTKKTLSMDEIWNIGLFLQIAIIEKIRQICEVIYISQIQKEKVENIVERLVEKKPKKEIEYKIKFKAKGKLNTVKPMVYPFIEHMSYTLKKYGKKAHCYLNSLEEIVEKTGNTVTNIIKEEHFDIAVNKVSMGNCILSIKEIQRINFLEIFEAINGVEEILKQDPTGIYDKMDHTTKEYYRNAIKEIAKKTKISEIYIAKKALKLSKEGDGKKAHIGYYLVADGVDSLYNHLQYKKSKQISAINKFKIYFGSILTLTIIITSFLSLLIYMKINKIWLLIISFILLLVPISELIIQIVHYVLSKIVKPKIIPKLDFYNGIDSKNATMVVIPTIVKSKEKVKELMEKLEVFYLANKSENIYFALLGDCSQSEKQYEEYDKEVVQMGKSEAERLNKKYKSDKFPIFHFLYRNRTWNEKEGSYLGWERKRGLLTQFNSFLLGKEGYNFKYNTMEKCQIPNIKYVITLDSDTDLILNSAFELVGAMAHILNEPVIDKEKNVVIDGYALIQPRIGVNLDVSYKNLFTKIFAGDGGIDSYTNAISDIYQDNFKEGIYTGKGIYNLQVFSKVLEHAIPENTVLSHDLLEGCYLRCGLATDILLMDGYPTKYASFMNRLSRWIRGDWQIVNWLGSKNLNIISKYKIFDNLRRSIFEAMSILSLLLFFSVQYFYKINMLAFNALIIAIVIIPFLLEIVNAIISKKDGEKRQKTFSPKIDGVKGAIIRGLLTLACLPYKAWTSENAKYKTLYRLYISKKHLLEWTTSEEAEKLSKNSYFSYYKMMIINIVFGAIFLILGIVKLDIFAVILGIIWWIVPGVMCFISKEEKNVEPIQKLDEIEKEYIKEIGKKTWKYFEENLIKENNYLIPDNYQEDRKPKVIDRTSSTNIGLSVMAVISAFDLGYIQKDKAIQLLENIIAIVEELPKWKGHLYNWYNIKTKQPLMPRYISTVDSGNFVGYLMVLKSFFEHEVIDENLVKRVDSLIQNTDFSILYSKEKRLLSIGFNIEENKLTDSYYDLLASEARQASLIAIAKKDVPAKHWNNLSRTLTEVNQYKGLISWSGTAFEYLMPNINIPRYKGSLLDESSKFLIMSQMEYSKILGIPWGISESAFNVKDLYLNYQYKAFGIPWLGLKRGLADDMVVSSYGSILAITDNPKRVIKNLKELEKYGMYNKYGFYESIDYTPERVDKGEIGTPVKTYMAHHQGLILLSINNLFNSNILQRRFIKNPEIEAVSILLQERMPKISLTTKESKEKVEKLKYKDYENYTVSSYNKIDERLVRANVISNQDYTIALNQKGEGVSKYKDIYINRFKKTDDYSQGIFFYIKNVKSNKIWSTNYSEYIEKPIKYNCKFSPDKDEIERQDGNIKTKMKVTVASNEAVEIRRLELENIGEKEEMLEITSYFEPVISKKEQDYAHQVFNNLFLIFSYEENDDFIKLKRKARGKDEKDYYLAVKMFTDSEVIGDNEYEIDKEKFIGRGNLKVPVMIEKSLPFSKKVGLVTEPIVAMRRTIKVKPKEKVAVDLIISVSEEEEKAKQILKEYANSENIRRTFELSKARVEAESRYLGAKGKNIEVYQKMLNLIIFDNPLKKEKLDNLENKKYKQSNLWKYGISGDIPIILVKVTEVNDIYVVRQMLKAYEFFKSKRVDIELVILDEEKHSYENYVKEEVEGAILNHHMSYMKNAKGGIFVLSKNEIDNEDYNLLCFVSSIIIDSHLGGLINQINEIEEEYLEKNSKIITSNQMSTFKRDTKNELDILKNNEGLKYFNGYGGFSYDGKEYLIKIDKENKLPTVWAHIMANEKFGTVCTENMGGYTWYKNSRLNRITAWHNTPTLDIPSEIIYIKDEETKEVCSLGCNPLPDDNNYNIIYGFGYAKYIHISNGIEQELITFVPREESVKVGLLKFKNTTPNKKKFSVYYYVKPVIGEDEIKSNQYIKLIYEEKNNIIFAKNMYEMELETPFVFVSSSEPIQEFTGNKKAFLGKGKLSMPDRNK